MKKVLVVLSVVTVMLVMVSVPHVKAKELGKLSTGIAYVFLNINGAPVLGERLGHVGGAFQYKNDKGELKFRCFATEGKNGQAFIDVKEPKDKGFWAEDVENDHNKVVATFKKRGYTHWKKLVVKNVDPEQANKTMVQRSKEDYRAADRNCQNDVYDVLHDEGSGYGITANNNQFFGGSKIYIGWVQNIKLGPTEWFMKHIGHTQEGAI